MDRLSRPSSATEEDKLLFVRLWIKMAMTPVATLAAHEALQQLQVELPSLRHLAFFAIDDADAEKRRLRQRFLEALTHALESPSRQLRKKIALECTQWVVADLKQQAVRQVLLPEPSEQPLGGATRDNKAMKLLVKCAKEELMKDVQQLKLQVLDQLAEEAKVAVEAAAAALICTHLHRADLILGVAHQFIHKPPTRAATH